MRDRLSNDSLEHKTGDGQRGGQMDGRGRGRVLATNLLPNCAYIASFPGLPTLFRLRVLY